MSRRETRPERIIRFIEQYLVVPEGAQVGKPIRLRPWQKDIIRNVYGTATRQAIISMGRKNGKTALIAMLVLAHLIGPEARRNGQIYSAAQSRDQAGIVFSLASKMVRMSSELSDTNWCVIRETKKEIYSPMTGVLYKALAAEASNAYGFSPVLVVHDELGQVRGPRSELYEALETAMGAQDAPLSLVISTQAPEDDDLLSTLIDGATYAADPAWKLILFAADPGAAVDDEAAWNAANPALGDFLNVEEIRKNAERSRVLPAFENAFRNLHLNQRVAAAGNLFGRDVWVANGAEPDFSVFDDRPVYGGLDLSARQDLTCLVLAAEDRDGIWHVKPEFWTPRDTLRERSERDRAPYDLWADRGQLVTVPGVSIDYGWVARRLAQLKSQCDLRVVRYDRWRIEELKSALTTIGASVPLAECGQGYRDMAPAIDALETVGLAHRMRHGMHPVLTMCQHNAIVTRDPAGNRKFDKSKRSGRIDGMVALAMAIGAGALQANRPVDVRALIG